MRYIIFILLMVVSTISQADCDPDTGYTADVACFAAKKYKEDEIQINSHIEALSVLLEKNGNEKIKSELVSGQNAWITYRNSECEAENKIYGGTESVSWAKCMARITSNRLQEIEDIVSSYSH